MLSVVVGGNVGPRIVGRMEGLHGGGRLIDLQAIKIYYEKQYEAKKEKRHIVKEPTKQT